MTPKAKRYEQRLDDAPNMAAIKAILNQIKDDPTITSTEDLDFLRKVGQECIRAMRIVRLAGEE